MPTVGMSVLHVPAVFSVLCEQESLCSLERPVEVQIQNSVESLLFHLALLSRNEGNPRLASGARPLVSRDISGSRVSQGAVTDGRGAVFYIWYCRQTWDSMALLSSMLRDGDKR